MRLNWRQLLGKCRPNPAPSDSTSAAPSQNRKRPGLTGKRSSIIAFDGLLASGADRQHGWQLSTTHQLVTAIDTEHLLPGYYLSFCKDDWSAPVERSAAATLADLRSDVGEPVFYLRQEHGGRKTDAQWLRQLLGPWIYATPRERLADYGADVPGGSRGQVKLVPGMALMRELLGNYPESANFEPPFVTGLLLPGTDVQVLILMVCTDNGWLETPDYIPLAGVDIDVAISAFVQSKHMSASGEWPAERTLIFEGSEIAAVLSRLHPYPSEPDFVGIPKSQLFRWSAVTLSAATVVSFAATGVLKIMTQHHRSDMATTQAQMTRLQQQEREELVVYRLGAYLAAQHVHAPQVMALARAVWLPSASLSVQATLQKVQITATYQNAATASNATGQAQRPLLDALTLSLPAGCERTGLATSNTVQLLKVTYTCVLQPNK